MTVVVAVDAMGGDHGPAVMVPAAIEFLRLHIDARVVLVGDADQLDGLTKVAADVMDRMQIHHAPQVVEMDEPPAKALRGKRESSMRLAIELVQTADAQACVSAGNTGALMAIARHLLRTLPGIDRPAIMRALPTSRGSTYMLDLGANAQCDPEHLLQFAIMGSVVAQAVGNITLPTIGLLNIGSEAGKGNDLVQRSAELIRAAAINFHGYIEGDDIYAGTTDVVVCDGFVGNVALKTSEGLARMVGEYLRRHYSRNIYTRLAALISAPVLRRFRADIDHRRYNGASLLGLRGVVIKSHGGSDVFGTVQALREAYREGHSDLSGRIAKKVEELLPQSQVA